jgi:hypothetical protein
MDAERFLNEMLDIANNGKQLNVQNVLLRFAYSVEGRKDLYSGHARLNAMMLDLRPR